jgi:signal peptidase I
MKWRPVIKGLLYAFIIAVVIRVFIVDVFSVNGDSMSPTINTGEYVIINRLAYLMGQPQRGDIIVTEPRGTYFKIVKRIAGVPGDRLEMSGTTLVIKKNREDAGQVVESVDFSLMKGYVKQNDAETDVKVFTVDPYEYFVLGDNRAVSIDSRKLGGTDAWSIKGKVFGKFSIKSFKYTNL